MKTGITVFLLVGLVTCKQRSLQEVMLLPVEENVPKETQSAKFIYGVSQCGGGFKVPSEISLIAFVDSKAITEQRLDVTIFKNGFSKGKFVTIYPVNDKVKSFAVLQTDKESSVSENMLSLTSLRVGKVQFENDIKAAERNSGQNLSGTEEMKISINSFEPGVNYFFRFLTLKDNKWESSSVIKVQGPICPIDESKKE